MVKRVVSDVKQDQRNRGPPAFMHVKMVADVWLVAVGEIKAGLQTSLSS